MNRKLTSSEIAAAMDSSVSGAKTRVRKGLTALSAKLVREPDAAAVSPTKDGQT